MTYLQLIQKQWGSLKEAQITEWGSEIKNSLKKGFISVWDIYILVLEFEALNQTKETPQRILEQNSYRGPFKIFSDNYLKMTKKHQILL